MGRLLGKFFGGAFVQESPSGTINGTNVTFTVANTPVTAGSFLLLQDGIALAQTADYTLSGSTITMTTAPALGQELLAHYLK